MQGLPEIGDVLDGTYKIESLLGTGGFGAVYLARQLSMDRQVALKILVANAMNVEEMIQRFRREVMACRNLGHPNTIRIYDFRDRPDGILYYTMEYVKGPTLKDVVKDDGPIPPRRVAHILKQICKSLAEAHSFGIIHRDLKPANIMLAKIAGETDFVKVVDFGIAKIVDDGDEDRDQLTNAGVLVGTLNYMSPEQIQGGEIGPVSDLYALGLIAIEMLMGRSVFDGTGRWEVLHKQISDEPVDVPQEVTDSELGELLHKVLQKKAPARYQSAEEMLNALNDLHGLSNEPIVESEEHAATAVLDSGAVAAALNSGSQEFSMPEAVPVESEPPLPEPVREPLRTESLDEATSPGDDAAPIEPTVPTSPAAFDDAPTAMHDSGVSPNPLHQPLPTGGAPIQPFTPMGVQTPDRQPAISPIGQPTGSQNAFVPSGDTDMGPAPSSNKGLIAVAGVILVLVAIAGVAVSQMGGEEVTPEEPVTEPVVAVTPPVEPPVEPIAVGKMEPIERENGSEPDTPTKEIRLITPGVKAQLYQGDKLIGDTPLRFGVGAKTTFTLRADGYEEEEVELSSESEELVSRKLQRVSVASNKPPTEKKPIEKKPIEKKPIEKKPIEEKPVDKPVEKKPKDDGGWLDVKKKKTDVPVF